MPAALDLPKRQPQAVSSSASTWAGYAELHCRSNFTFLEGASHPDELVQRAVELGYTALAITDRNSLAGIVRAFAAAKESTLKLITGAEITPADGPPLVLWATDRAAYGRLCRLITCGRRRAEKGACLLTVSDIAEHAEGLLAGLTTHSPPPSLFTAAAASAASPLNSHQATPDPAIVRSPFTSFPNPSSQRQSFPAAQNKQDPDQQAPQQLTAKHLTQPQQEIRSTAASERPLLDYLGQYRDIFGDRCYFLAELHYGPDDEQVLDWMLQLAKQAGLPAVAAGDVCYHIPARMPLQQVLTAIQYNTTVAELGPRLLPHARRHLRSREELRAIFARAPELLQRTLDIARRCSFSLSELRYEYPEELAPPGETPHEYLTRLAEEGARQRYGRVPEKVRQQLRYELKLIADLKYEAFFLTVYDIVQFARSRRILCQGRGSAANSTVCYCLGVTAVDPMETDLLFERFISRERNEAPDIDVDFEHERREEVIQYIYEKYGRDRAGLAATVITYRPRSAIRDVGKALGLSLDRVEVLTKQVDHRAEDTLLPQRCQQAGIDPNSGVGQQLLRFVEEILGFPRHLSQHVGGMVITRGALCELTPIENAAMTDRTVIEWDKDDLDTLGILKVDCLALGMLTAIHRCWQLLERHLGRSVSIDEVPRDDTRVFDMICRADTVGVFQIESRAQMSMLPRLRPRRFYDLVIEVAIVRPGPIQGNMVHPYLRRRNGEEAITYPNPEIQKVLHRTLGVPLFQEQAMQLAMVAAGFTPGEADQLRRAMGAWRRTGLMDRFRQQLVAGMQERGYTLEFAESLFNQIRGFGEYGFPESHAASFAILAYVSAWIKYYYPAVFTAALINSQPMGFYAPAQLIRDAREHGVQVLPVDVNRSYWDCDLEPIEQGVDSGPDQPPTSFSGPARKAPSHAAHTSAANSVSTDQRDPPSSSHALRLGFRLVRGLRQTELEALVAERQAHGPFQSLAELTQRTRISAATLQRLAESDAFRSLGHDRRAALWQSLVPPSSSQPMPLFDSAETEDAPTPRLPALSSQEEVFADYRMAGVTLRQHPISFLREHFQNLGIITAQQLRTCPTNRAVRVAGLVLMRQRPSTAKGITFVTLEDETGTINLVIRPGVWKLYDLIARNSSALIAHGVLERKQEIIHVVVRQLADLATQLGELTNKTRDFR